MARGFAPDDPVAALRESGADMSPGDVPQAIEDCRNVYEALIEQRAAP
jgi:hypothetical protein